MSYLLINILSTDFIYVHRFNNSEYRPIYLLIRVNMYNWRLINIILFGRYLYVSTEYT